MINIYKFKKHRRRCYPVRNLLRAHAPLKSLEGNPVVVKKGPTNVTDPSLFL